MRLHFFLYVDSSTFITRLLLTVEVVSSLLHSNCDWCLTVLNLVKRKILSLAELNTSSLRY